MRKNRHIYLGVGVLAMLAMAFAMVLRPVTRASTEGDGGPAVYVSADGGSDETGNGSEASSYASLAKAVENAKDGATIYVMSDLEVTECARFYDKSLTITSGHGGLYTLSRSAGFKHFESQSDTATDAPPETTAQATKERLVALLAHTERNERK